MASVAKPCGRVHNQNSMVGVFGPAKIDEYLTETSEYALPMIRIARRSFPRQDGAYANIKPMLDSQVALIRQMTAS